ncbi:hypothetical protein Tco_0466320 [Tanacetum coccineum]
MLSLGFLPRDPHHILLAISGYLDNYRIRHQYPPPSIRVSKVISVTQPVGEASLALRLHRPVTVVVPALVGQPLLRAVSISVELADIHEWNTP